MSLTAQARKTLRRCAWLISGHRTYTFDLSGNAASFLQVPVYEIVRELREQVEYYSERTFTLLWSDVGLQDLANGETGTITMIICRVGTTDVCNVVTARFLREHPRATLVTLKLGDDWAQSVSRPTVSQETAREVDFIVQQHLKVLTGKLYRYVQDRGDESILRQFYEMTVLDYSEQSGVWLELDQIGTFCAEMGININDFLL